MLTVIASDTKASLQEISTTHVTHQFVKQEGNYQQTNHHDKQTKYSRNRTKREL